MPEPTYADLVQGKATKPAALQRALAALAPGGIAKADALTTVAGRTPENIRQSIWHAIKKASLQQSHVVRIRGGEVYVVRLTAEDEAKGERP